jgi:hypothetical protein
LLTAQSITCQKALLSTKDIFSSSLTERCFQVKIVRESSTANNNAAQYLLTSRP